MRVIFFPIIPSIIFLFLFSCGVSDSANMTPQAHPFDEKLILPMYEKKPLTPGPRHGDALVGNLKYGPDFTHFDYVNPDAPVGGTLTLASRRNFDNFNPVTIKGTPPNGYGLPFETLMTGSLDEPASQYGLLAESIEYPEDKTWVSFVLRAEARWHDGSPVTVEDVIYSFNTIRENSPIYSQYYADVIRVEKAGDRKVTFSLKPGSNPELPHILGQVSVIPRHFFASRNDDAVMNQPPPGSGPYRVKDFEMGRSITYERVADYWGSHLPVNNGMYNFQTIRYITYLDTEVMFQGFKAGEFDFMEENSASRWTNEYKGPQFEDGKIRRELIQDYSPQGIQGMIFNTRRDIFKDRLVREAMSYLFDFEFVNRQAMYNSYTRSKSYWENSVFASYLGGLPDEGELKYLNPFKDQLPPEVFTKVYEPPKTDGSGNIRDNMKKALELFARAGWIIKDGKLVNSNGTWFTFEFLTYDSRSGRILDPFVENCKRAGINASYRVLDFTNYFSQIQEFDFDIIDRPLGQSFSPGNEQRYYWGSKAADNPGSENYAGIKNPVVDSLIESVIMAKDFREMRAATRALDRVLLWNHYLIPEWYLNYFRIAYYPGRIERPTVRTPILTAVIYETAVVSTWWALPGQSSR